MDCVAELPFCEDGLRSVSRRKPKSVNKNPLRPIVRFYVGGKLLKAGGGTYEKFTRRNK